MKKILVLSFMVVLTANIQAQRMLTLDEAIDMALKSNFDILVARNDADIDRVNNTRGNAGMLPSITMNGTGTYGLNNVYQRLSTGVTNNYSSQSSTNLGANVQLSWTLYDGGKMFITKNKLAEIQSLGELQFRSKVMEVTYNVISAYYNIVRQKQELKSMNEVMNYNKQRVLIAKTGYASGQIVKTELLQAQIDLNVAAESAINQEYAISEAQKALNNVLAQDAKQDFDVADSIPESKVPDINELLLRIESSNADILAYKKQIDIAKLALKEAQKGYYPTFNLQSGYSLSQLHYSEGSMLRNNSNGFLIGGTLSIPIYNFGETKRKVSVAKIQLQSAKYDLDDAKLQVSIELQNAYKDFKTQQQLLTIEKDNNLLAKENLEISLSRLKLGQTTSLEVHQAQENYMESLTRFINFQYELKIEEAKVKQLISSL